MLRVTGFLVLTCAFAIVVLADVSSRTVPRTGMSGDYQDTRPCADFQWEPRKTNSCLGHPSWCERGYSGRCLDRHGWRRSPRADMRAKRKTVQRIQTDTRNS